MIWKAFGEKLHFLVYHFFLWLALFVPHAIQNSILPLPLYNPYGPSSGSILVILFFFLSYLLSFLGFLAPFILSVSSEFLFSTTIGKWIFELLVCDELGSPISWSQTIIRNLSKLLPGMALMFSYYLTVLGLSFWFFSASLINVSSLIYSRRLEMTADYFA